MTKEDSGNDPELEILQQAAEIPNAMRARKLAESVVIRPLTDDQATALASVYGSLAVHDALTSAITALESLSTALVTATASSTSQKPPTTPRAQKPAQQRSTK